MIYLNEFAREPASWLRELYPDAAVDDRSIVDVRTTDLVGFKRCHFFAGIGGWELALHLAGVPDTLPVWTGSCPCQPFSVAGKGKGAKDERHLWPEFRRLISECLPSVVFGEQVGSRAGREWLAGVRVDLEALGYAVGAADLCAACAGAPHIRQRLYWGAVRLPLSDSFRCVGGGAAAGPEARTVAGPGLHVPTGTVRLSDAHLAGFDRSAVHSRSRRPGQADVDVAGYGSVERVGNALNARPQGLGSGVRGGPVDCGGRLETPTTGGAGFWSRYDVLPFTDGKARRIEPGTFPLVAGLPRRVGYSGDPSAPGYAQNTAEARTMRLRGYGNAIVSQLAAVFIRAFIQAFMEVSG